MIKNISLLKQENKKSQRKKRLYRFYSELFDKNEMALQERRLIGDSKAIRKIQRQIDAVSRSEASVILYGETGVGKELAARIIHYRSGRRERPFLALACNTIPETLFESELFGYSKGSFTGAIQDRAGLFEKAEGGTLFLDEVAEIPLAVQSKLLRVLQEREIRRIGSHEAKKINVRLINATNADLEEMVREGSFRKDLYYRLHIVPIHLPSLRERREDIPALCDFFIFQLSMQTHREPIQISDEVKQSFQHYPWPGNVRELKNLIERFYVMVTKGIIEPRHLPVDFFKPVTADRGEKDLSLEASEKQHILYVLDRFDWKKKEVAQALGIDPSNLYRKMKKFRIGKHEKKAE